MAIVDSQGYEHVKVDDLTLTAGDLEIGQVELKDSDSTAQANIKAANTARTTGTVVVATQNIDAAGNVIGIDAANTARTTGTKVLPVQQVSAAGAVDTLTTVTTVGTLTGGGVAANAADSGNPVKIGGKYTAAGVTLDDGDRGDIALDSKSNLNSNLNTLISGEDQTNDVMKSEQQFSYSYLTADGQVKASAGFLHTITISPTDAAATAGTIIIYDNTAESGTIVFSYTVPAAALVPVTLTFDIKMLTGIYVGFTTTADVGVTVSYR
jgi:hypothetical protein